nr:PorT family protein [Bacteroidales bacterium]
FAYAGPTLNVGLISKTKADASVALVTITKTEYDNYAEGSEYGRFDVMIGGGAGIQFQNMKVYGGYNYGLLDRNSGATNLHRSEIVAGVAFNF